jgi:hypothetical protein
LKAGAMIEISAGSGSDAWCGLLDLKRNSRSLTLVSFLIPQSAAKLAAWIGRTLASGH